ncbi:inositol-3-phosphate synthase [Halococcus saccharolyticus]|uniref:Myo-inositol-1-phosphate synthase n=1 Tax=Halococcus saccharolyticus DSM 5350 TaxID=1227455 RepID=M0MJU7_9EURY|nr:inositol-3-phosphate synthase [Halococcus saccharolyticus]EMA44725.1 myo-inositol-1-phosphate synthase [Halococcus saccharolyticus DSM 5350]
MTTGVWLIGARGNVATTAMIGARAIAREATVTDGMVTERAPLTDLDLPAVGSLVFGGHDIQAGSVVETAERLHERNGVPDRDTLDAVRDDLATIDDRIVTGTARNCGRTVAELTDDAAFDDETLSLREIVERIRADYAAFQENEDLDRVVVVNVASAEPMPADPDQYDSVGAIEAGLDADDPLPASALYAYAAIDDGHPFVNFTPNAANALGGIRELADRENVPHMGRDGKTGETLLKSALAPMFAGRNLRVLSWEGHNILGNRDGEVLEDDANKAGKLQSKGGVLDEILEYDTHNRVRIDYTPALGDWKTAWDDIRFQGFLGTQMKLQFTWEGSDSALAAPLVLDLVRLLAHADEQGEGGLQPHLASFFKDPLGVDEHDLSRQFDRLYEYADQHRNTSTANEETENTP